MFFPYSPTLSRFCCQAVNIAENERKAIIAFANLCLAGVFFALIQRKYDSFPTIFTTLDTETDRSGHFGQTKRVKVRVRKVFSVLTV